MLSYKDACNARHVFIDVAWLPVREPEPVAKWEPKPGERVIVKLADGGDGEGVCVGPSEQLGKFRVEVSIHGFRGIVTRDLSKIRPAVEPVQVGPKVGSMWLCSEGVLYESIEPRNGEFARVKSEFGVYPADRDEWERWIKGGLEPVL